MERVAPTLPAIIYGFTNVNLKYLNSSSDLIQDSRRYRIHDKHNTGLVRITSDSLKKLLWVGVVPVNLIGHPTKHDNSNPKYIAELSHYYSCEYIKLLVNILHVINLLLDFCVPNYNKVDVISGELDSLYSEFSDFSINVTNEELLENSTNLVCISNVMLNVAKESMQTVANALIGEGFNDTTVGMDALGYFIAALDYYTSKFKNLLINMSTNYCHVVIKHKIFSHTEKVDLADENVVFYKIFSPKNSTTITTS